MPLPTDLAATQHGLLTRQQLSAAGHSAKQVWRAVKRGHLARLSPTVFRVPGSSASSAQRLLAAILDAGEHAALSHTTALAWWGVRGFSTSPVHVTAGRLGGRPRTILVDHLHLRPRLPENHLQVLEGIPLVCPARALFDLAGMSGLRPGRVERAVDNAWAERLVSGASLHAMLGALEGRGRPGLQLMRQLLAERGSDYVPPASGLEARVVQILKRAAERPLRRQVNCGDDTNWIGRVDFADTEVPFLLEIQSERFHSSLLDRRADHERLARLRAAGYVVATVTDSDVWHHPARVLATIREGRVEARRRLFHQAA